MLPSQKCNPKTMCMYIKIAISTKYSENGKNKVLSYQVQLSETYMY